MTRLATLSVDGTELAAVVLPGRGVAAVGDVLPDLTGDLLDVIASGRVDEVDRAARDAPDSVFRAVGDVRFAPPYRRPRKIWGIGLNYVEHASDLTETVPEEPASFIKADHTIIGPDDPIPVPAQSSRTTAEAELGLVIGRECRDVAVEQALDHVFGVCNVLDQTAEDILERNPRFLTRSKNFPGFFSFGPEVATIDDVLGPGAELGGLEVVTVVNDTTRRNTVAHMRFDPAFLVAFHSRVMPLFPGDVIATGTPGAVQIRPGDVAECRIPGLGVLRNPVVAQDR
jgi:2-keto-4-pentenoate hydratase/2-oxohepta-3-ene-1,7-dioic acid hydratase in catechol pathway